MFWVNLGKFSQVLFKANTAFLFSHCFLIKSDYKGSREVCDTKEDTELYLFFFLMILINLLDFFPNPQFALSTQMPSSNI